MLACSLLMPKLGFECAQRRDSGDGGGWGSDRLKAVLPVRESLRAFVNGGEWGALCREESAILVEAAGRGVLLPWSTQCPASLLQETGKVSSCSASRHLQWEPKVTTLRIKITIEELRKSQNKKILSAENVILIH